MKKTLWLVSEIDTDMGFDHRARYATLFESWDAAFMRFVLHAYNRLHDRVVARADADSPMTWTCMYITDRNDKSTCAYVIIVQYTVGVRLHQQCNYEPIEGTDGHYRQVLVKPKDVDSITGCHRYELNIIEEVQP